MNSSKLFHTGIGLVVVGAMVWLGLLVWTFGLGHADDPLTSTFQWGSTLGVFGPMVLGAVLLAMSQSPRKVRPSKAATVARISGQATDTGRDPARGDGGAMMAHLRQSSYIDPPPQVGEVIANGHYRVSAVDFERKQVYLDCLDCEPLLQPKHGVLVFDSFDLARWDDNGGA